MTYRYLPIVTETQAVKNGAIYHFPWFRPEVQGIRGKRKTVLLSNFGILKILPPDEFPEIRRKRSVGLSIGRQVKESSLLNWLKIRTQKIDLV